MQGQEVIVNWGNVILWGLIGQWVFNIALAAWVYLREKDTKNEKAIKTVADELHQQSERLGRVEAVMEHMPSAEEMRNVRETVASTKARVEGMGELLQRVDHQTRLIHEHLLRNH